jgi:hypothetical protein
LLCATALAIRLEKKGKSYVCIPYFLVVSNRGV